MSSLINRIQRAMLGSSGEAKVRALLAELAIPAGGSGGSMREVRRGFLRPISDEAILRDALARIGLTGSGTGARPLSDVRTAILHNLRDSEAVLRDGLNDLLAPEDLSEGGGGAPGWLPEGAVAYADFVNGHYYAGGSEKALAQIIASPGKVVAGEGLGFSDTEDTGVAMLGDFAAAFLTVNWTIDLSWKVPTNVGSRDCTVFSVHDADGTDLVQATVYAQGPLKNIQDWIDDWNDIGREAVNSSIGTETNTILNGSVTRTNAGISLHYKTTSVSDNSFTFGFTPTVAEFGDAPGDFYYPGTIFIRTVAVFPPGPLD